MSRLFLPPINRTMHTFDPAFFQKTIPLAAAHVFDSRNIPRVTKACAGDILRVPRLRTIVTEGERKLVLLRPEVKIDDPSTLHEPTLELVQSNVLELVPYNLHMEYDNWNYQDIMNAILPPDLSDIPCAFTQAGHLAHLNLRENYLPYKYLIARILLDKNPHISTVVNKIQDVGTGSVFRTFPMELLAGEPDTKVEVRESGCVFKFDFAKVYWNSRLGNEHWRVVSLFEPGEAVADVMAGVGPFAIPAAKRGVWVFANDLNPESYGSLGGNIAANKVANLVSPFNQDGRDFIRTSIRALPDLSKSSSGIPTTAIAAPAPRRPNNRKRPPVVKPVAVPLPPTFSHFILNLPASAITFLDAFRGAYTGLEHLFSHDKGRKLPMIHVYTFHKSPETEDAAEDICADITKHLGYEVKQGDLVNLQNVRLVAPNKTYYCASFRLPPEVAFASEGGKKIE